MTAPRPRNLRHLLTRVTVIIGEDGYTTDQDLATDLGISLTDLYTVVSIAYRQRKVDRIDGYLVAPAHGELPPASRRAALDDGGLKASASRLRPHRLARLRG